MRVHPYLIILAALFFFDGCSFQDSLKAANAGVVKFHADFNAQRFDDIYQTASPEYKQAAPMELNRKFLTGVKKKLGEAGEWSLAGWRVNSTLGGTTVSLQCKTKFARGDADESFVWKVSGKSASLMGYHVNSPLFVVDQ